MPFGRLFGTLGGHFRSPSGPIRQSYRSHSVSLLALLWYSYLLSFIMDQARLTCHLSGAFTGLLDVHHVLGELIVLDCGVRSLGLLGVCFSIHL